MWRKNAQPLEWLKGLLFLLTESAINVQINLIYLYWCTRKLSDAKISKSYDITSIFEFDRDLILFYWNR